MQPRAESSGLTIHVKHGNVEQCIASHPLICVAHLLVREHIEIVRAREAMQTNTTVNTQKAKQQKGTQVSVQGPELAGTRSSQRSGESKFGPDDQLDKRKQVGEGAPPVQQQDTQPSVSARAGYNISGMR